MSEYIINLEGELGMALAVACAGAGFAREEIVRCRDCMRYSLDDYGNTWCAYVASAVQPDDFCAWGEPRGDWLTCKCGEDIEAPSGRAVCPSCGRTVMA